MRIFMTRLAGKLRLGPCFMKQPLQVQGFKCLEPLSHGHGVLLGFGEFVSGLECLSCQGCFQ